MQKKGIDVVYSVKVRESTGTSVTKHIKRTFETREEADIFFKKLTETFDESIAKFNKID